MMFLTKEDKVQFDSWTKEQIYEAYLAEHKMRVKLNSDLNDIRRKIAYIRSVAV